MMLLKVALMWASPKLSTFTTLFFAAAFALVCCCALAIIFKIGTQNTVNLFRPCSTLTCTRFPALNSSMVQIYNGSVYTAYILLLRCLLLTGNCFSLTFSCTRICFCSLSSYRQSLAMTQSTVASNIQQTLDRHLNLRTQLTFHF